MRPLLKQVAGLIGGALRDLRAILEPRLKAIEDMELGKALDNLRERIGAVDAEYRTLAQQRGDYRAETDKAIEACLEIKVDTKELQETLEEAQQALTDAVLKEREQTLSMVEDRIRLFHEAALAREAPQNELIGQLKAVLEEQANRPSMEAVVKGVVEALRGADSAICAQAITAANEAARASTDAWRKDFCEQLEAIVNQVKSIPSAETLAKSAADLVPAPKDVDLTGFVKHEQLENGLGALKVRIDEVFEALPSTQDLAKSAAALVPPTDIPELLQTVQGMITSDREEHAPTPLSLDEVAKKAATLVEIPAPPTLEEVAVAAAALVPKAKDGEDGKAPTIKEIMSAVDIGVAYTVGERLKTMEEAFSDRLSNFMSAITVPKDGTDGPTVDEVNALVSKAVASLVLPTPEQIAGSLEGTHLAKWALDFERRAQDLLQRSVDRIQIPKDGLDGMGFEDMTVDFDGVRTLTFALARDGRRKTFDVKMPIMVHQGIFKETSIYDKGDAVTWGGSAWLALKDNPAGKPGDSHDWQLIVKKGQNGKDK